MTVKEDEQRVPQSKEGVTGVPLPRRREERKKAQKLAIETGEWSRCMYRVPGKRRFCAQQRCAVLDAITENALNSA